MIQQEHKPEQQTVSPPKKDETLQMTIPPKKTKDIIEFIKQHKQEILDLGPFRNPVSKFGHYTIYT